MFVWPQKKKTPHTIDLSFLLNAMPCWTSHMCGSWQNKVSARQCWSLGMTTWMFVLSFTWERYWWGVDGSTCSNICLKSGGSKCLKSNDADYYSRDMLWNWILNTMGPLRLTDKMAVSVSSWEIMSRGKLQMWPPAHYVIALHPRWGWIPSQRSWVWRCSTYATPTEDPTTELWHPPGITVLENIEVLGSTVEELLFWPPSAHVQLQSEAPATNLQNNPQSFNDRKRSGFLSSLLCMCACVS